MAITNDCIPMDVYTDYTNSAQWLMRQPTFNPMQLLALRLRIQPGENILPFKFYSAYVDNDVAFLYYIHEGEFVAMKDDPDLFPSDDLLARIKVLLKGLGKL